jgi:hypothetical protein
MAPAAQLFGRCRVLERANQPMANERVPAMKPSYAEQAKFIVACAILLSAAGAGRAHAEEYFKSYSLNGRASVQVDAQLGAVRVTPALGNKVEFDVTYERRDWASDPRIQSRQDGNSVALRALGGDNPDGRSWWNGWGWWGWGGNYSHRLDIEVRMPKDADLRLQTTNGAIDVSSVDGNISIQTRNGRISARQLSGTIDIGSTNGGIELDTLKGALTVHSSNGHITASRLDGKCDLSTSNGWIQVEGRFESLDIGSTNGAIDGRVESGSRMSSSWHIRTTNGRVDLSVPTDLKANLNVDTNNGRIKLDLPVAMQGFEDRGLVRGTLNGGGPELSISTTNAGIHVRGI